MNGFFLLLAMTACTGSEDADKPADDSAAADADTDTDTDTDTDADTDADTDTDTDAPDLTTYRGFVEAHAAAYCASLSTCEFLDEQGYADIRACAAGVRAFYDAITCDAYQMGVAEACVRGDVQMRSACETSNSGEAPLACRDVCTAPAP